MEEKKSTEWTNESSTSFSNPAVLCLNSFESCRDELRVLFSTWER